MKGSALVWLARADEMSHSAYGNVERGRPSLEHYFRHLQICFLKGIDEVEEIRDA